MAAARASGSLKGMGKSDNWKIRFGDEWPNDTYCARGRCYNCGDTVQILVKKGTLLSDVQQQCQHCEATNYTVTSS